MRSIYIPILLTALSADRHALSVLTGKELHGDSIRDYLFLPFEHFGDYLDSDICCR